MNILISVNTDYLEKAKTMLFSLRLHNNEKIVVYLLNHSLSQEQVGGFSDYLRDKCQIDTISIDVKQTEFDNMPLGEMHFSIEMYYRVLAQYLLPHELERILWLDADIIILKDIRQFYNQNIDEFYYVVCADRSPDSKSVKISKKQLGLKDDHKYFNSGVMLINLNFLRKQVLRSDIIQTSQLLSEKLTYPDQDLLNCMYSGKVKYADSEIYNYQVKDDPFISKDIMDKIAILHYCGKKKPWIYTDVRSSSMPYWRVRYLQGYKNEVKGLYKNLIIDSLKQTICFLKDYFKVKKK